MKLKTILLTLAVSLILIISVLAYSSNEITAPAAYSTSSTLTVNVSGGINASSYDGIVGGSVVNVTILNKSSSSGAYGILAASLSLTCNASNGSLDYFWNYTATFTEGRQWIKLNFTNVSFNNNVGSLSAERIVQIDLDATMLSLYGGKINFTDTGNINISGTIGLGEHNMSFITQDGTKACCGVSDANVWGCVSC